MKSDTKLYEDFANGNIVVKPFEIIPSSEIESILGV